MIDDNRDWIRLVGAVRNRGVEHERWPIVQQRRAAIRLDVGRADAAVLLHRELSRLKIDAIGPDEQA